MGKIPRRTYIVFAVTGSALWFTGILLLNFQLHENRYDDIPILKILSELPPILTLLFPVIIAPVIEEFAFRLWVKKGKAVKFISFAAMNAAVYFLGDNLYIFGFYLLASIIIFWIWPTVKSNKTVALLVLSSTAFGIIHLHNYSGWFQQLSGIVCITGLGIILGVIAIKYGFRYAVIGHVGYNLVLSLIGGVFFQTNEHRGVSDADFKYSFSEASLFSTQFNTSVMKDDSVYIFGTKSFIVSEICPFSRDTVFRMPDNSFEKFEFNAKGNPDTKIKRKQLFKSFIQELNFKTDTLNEAAKKLIISDTALLRSNRASPENPGILVTIKDMAKIFRSDHRENLIVDLPHDEYLTAYYIDNYGFIEESDYKARKNMIEDMGLRIVDTDKNATVIYLSHDD